MIRGYPQCKHSRVCITEDVVHSMYCICMCVCIQVSCMYVHVYIHTNKVVPRKSRPLTTRIQSILRDVPPMAPLIVSGEGRRWCANMSPLTTHYVLTTHAWGRSLLTTLVNLLLSAFSVLWRVVRCGQRLFCTSEGVCSGCSSRWDALWCWRWSIRVHKLRSRIQVVRWYGSLSKVRARN